MVIDSNSLNSNIGGTQSKNQAVSEKKADAQNTQTKQSGANADAVSLSAEAQSLTSLEAAVAASPDTDLERVKDVQTALRSGEYQINAEKIARSIIDHTL